VDDNAARDAADRQAALAEITDIANNMSGCARPSCCCSGRSIAIGAKSRRHAQTRGELFAILTCGSFKTLQLEFDDHDNMQLAGIRQDGRRVPVAGMSSWHGGSALSCAPHRRGRDYLGHAEPMPFIADDLFINFDDNRAPRASACWANSPKRRKSVLHPPRASAGGGARGTGRATAESRCRSRRAASATLAGRMSGPEDQIFSVIYVIALGLFPFISMAYETKKSTFAKVFGLGFRNFGHAVAT